jgi:hypothetical protein
MLIRLIADGPDSLWQSAGLEIATGLTAAVDLAQLNPACHEEVSGRASAKWQLATGAL